MQLQQPENIVSKEYFSTVKDSPAVIAVRFKLELTTT